MPATARLPLSRGSRCSRSIGSTCEGNHRLSKGEVLAMLQKPPGPQRAGGRSCRVAAGVAELAVGRGCVASQDASLDGGCGRFSSARRSASAESTDRCIWSTIAAPSSTTTGRTTRISICRSSMACPAIRRSCVRTPSGEKRGRVSRAAGAAAAGCAPRAEHGGADFADRRQRFAERRRAARRRSDADPARQRAVRRAPPVVLRAGSGAARARAGHRLRRSQVRRAGVRGARTRRARAAGGAKTAPAKGGRPTQTG